MKLILGLAAFVAASTAQAAPPPAELFGQVPVIVDIDISGSGRRVAILGGPEDQRTVNVATIDETAMPSFPLGGVEAVSVIWAGEDRVIARVATWKHYSRDRDFRFERNLSIDPASGKTAWLLKNSEESTWMLNQPVLFSGAGPNAKMTLMGMSLGVEGYQYGLWRVDPATGDGRLIERGAPSTTRWWLDEAGNPRLRLDINHNQFKYLLMSRPKGVETGYKAAIEGSIDDIDEVLGYSAPDDGVYLRQGDQVVRKSLKDGSVETVGHTRAPEFDLHFDGAKRTAIAISRWDYEREKREWLEPKLAAAQAALDRLFKDQQVGIYDWSDNYDRLVIYTTSPAKPLVWYLFDSSRKELSPLGEASPQFAGVRFGATRWIDYVADDGLAMHAFLTMPPEAGAKAPLIVLPHAGLGGRDDFAFDYLVQFLATRGYAVLQPQFRGSTGFGKAFYRAADGEWAGKVQTDLLDAVKAVASLEGVDAKRVCVVGEAFGGYLAMSAAAFHSDAYRCAASIGGISDLAVMHSDALNAYGRDSAAMRQFRRSFGQARGDQLAASSPNRRAKDVAIPLLLMHGDQDTWVDIKHSEAMLKAMKVVGKPVDYVVLKGDGDGLIHSATRTQALKSLEAFLAKNLPVTP